MMKTKKDLSDFIPTTKLQMLTDIYNTLNQHEKHQDSLDFAKIEYTEYFGDVDGICMTHGPFLRLDADAMQKALDALHVLKARGLLETDKLEEIRSHIIVKALHKVYFTEGGQRAGFRKSLSSNGRPGDFALNIILFLLVHYARVFDTRNRPHYHEIADYLSEVTGNIYSYNYIMERYRKLDETRLVQRYWILCRVSCGTEMPRKTGGKYYRLSKIPDWDSIYPSVENEPVYLVENHKFVTKLYHSKPAS